jgi:hypothetical protein
LYHPTSATDQQATEDAIANTSPCRVKQ